MPLSTWLRVLATVLGLTKSKPADIQRTKQAAEIAEAIEAATNPPPADKPK